MKESTTGIKIAVMLVLVFFGYFVAVTFFPMPDQGEEQAKTIVPFILGIVATLIGFYWGNSHKPEQVPAITQMEEDAKAAAAKIEQERIEAAKKEAEKVEAMRIEAAKVEAEKVIEAAKIETPKI